MTTIGEQLVCWLIEYYLNGTKKGLNWWKTFNHLIYLP
jgi:hypothetical protein